jgi:hypothetical protein
METVMRVKNMNNYCKAMSNQLNENEIKVFDISGTHSNKKINCSNKNHRRDGVFIQILNPFKIRIITQSCLNIFRRKNLNPFLKNLM